MFGSSELAKSLASPSAPPNELIFLELAHLLENYLSDDDDVLLTSQHYSPTTLRCDLMNGETGEWNCFRVRRVMAVSGNCDNWSEYNSTQPLNTFIVLGLEYATCDIGEIEDIEDIDDRDLDWRICLLAINDNRPLKNEESELLDDTSWVAILDGQNGHILNGADQINALAVINSIRQEFLGDTYADTVVETLPKVISGKNRQSKLELQKTLTPNQLN